MFAKNLVNSLIKYKVQFLSDATKLTFYFLHQPHYKQINLSNNKFEIVLHVDDCYVFNKKITEKLNTDLVSEFIASNDKNITKIQIKKKQLTQFRIISGYDKYNKLYFISVFIYKPYENYSKYEARIAEILRYKKQNIPIVVIDPGHGGKDPGTKSIYGNFEKNLNLKFAYKIADLINRSKKAKAYLTRYGDHFMSLSRRVFLANQYHADVFISIHFNANKSKKVRGFETYYLSYGAATDKASELLANIENTPEFLDDTILSEYDYQVQSILLDLKEKENIKESGILANLVTDYVSQLSNYPISLPKQANFVVLRNLNMPSVLIEIGYLSNKDDIYFINKNFDKICSKIAQGIIEYLYLKDK